ncbi:hypothetical protein DY000_02009321 [Brassica cretica]|uniref:Uncharacterized protein n=1 Tax=Brassica cretica TaxID=69181 RepID=A0ABQ7CJ73_BRACR|nr:hypothetical protein DY000_02009321 [Brassica cretica]
MGRGHRGSKRGTQLRWHRLRQGDLESTHHEAMMDTVDLSRSQRLLVAYATRLAREGSENIVVGDATECARDGQSGAVPVDSITLRAYQDGNLADKKNTIHHPPLRITLGEE